MINGIAYGFEDITIQVMGDIIQGATEIEYTGSRERSNIHAKGADPYEQGRGPKNYSGKIVMLQSAFQRIEDLYGDPLDAAGFRIVVAYANASQALRTDLLHFCSINDFTKGMATGDDHMTIECPITIGKVRLNV